MTTHVRNIKGIAHRLVVLKVVTYDSNGLPRALEVLHDHETVDVSDEKNRHFITAFIPVDNFKKKS